MFWFKFMLTAAALAVVLYFQFFFDFSNYAEEINEAKRSELSQQRDAGDQKNM